MDGIICKLQGRDNNAPSGAIDSELDSLPGGWRNLSSAIQAMTIESSALTRFAGEALLRDFTPRMGGDYARDRNFDDGPGAHRGVSRLSPYVRRRLVLEKDLVRAALAAHGLRGAEKFIQEVFWRAYFKGWLEHRPEIWVRYRVSLDECLHGLSSDPILAERVSRAESGTTGLECFDAWAKELIDTGYLHNHARMWFASIWIFTLKLPWQIGADFFLRYLLDGDPASNTLSWRWVAGLHTRGKAYAADESNIAKYTRNRFRPQTGELTRVERGLEDTEPDGLPERTALRSVHAPDPALPTVLVLTEEDCRLEDFNLQGLSIRGVASIVASRTRSPREVSGRVIFAEDSALADAATRLAEPVKSFQSDELVSLAKWAQSVGARQLVMPFLTRGPLFDLIEPQRSRWTASGLRLAEWQRDWDRVAWPFATSGFFKLKDKIPALIRTLGL